MKPKTKQPTQIRRTAKQQDAVAAQEDAQEAAESRPANQVMVKPVVNTVQILRYLSQAGSPARAVDIARHLAINPSTCFNILRTLAAENVVDFDKLSKTYSVGLGLAMLVENMVTQGQRLQLARPPMLQFATRFAVTATLWRRIGPDRIVLVCTETSPADLRIDMAPGQRLPILMGASGRLFASRMNIDDTELRAIFEETRWARPLSFETYRDEVALCLKRGWAVDDGHFSAGIMVIAAPVLDRSGELAFTVSAIMFRGQYDAKGIATVGASIGRLGEELSDILF